MGVSSGRGVYYLDGRINPCNRWVRRPPGPVGSVEIELGMTRSQVVA